MSRYNEIMFDNRLNMDQPAVFRIRLQMEIDLEWEAWFEHMTVTVENGVTTLTGPVADQSALHSLLAKIRDLGLPLIYLERIDTL